MKKSTVPPLRPPLRKLRKMTVTALVVFVLVIVADAHDEDGGDVVLCPCKFDGNDSDECRVYGQLGDVDVDIEDRTLIPWHRATQECLDSWNIKIQAVPSSTLELMCGDPPNTNAFVNYLKFESTEAAVSIKQSYGQFWDGDANPPSFVATINGVDCASDASGCWNEIKSYFESNPDEVRDNCETFRSAAAKDAELEQSTARIRLCNEDDSSAECSPLNAQIQQVKSDNPGSECSAFGLGPATLTLPSCDDDNDTTSSTSRGSDGDETSSGATATPAAYRLAALVATTAATAAAALLSLLATQA